MAHMPPEEQQDDALPRSLVEALKAADRPVPMITARVDRRVSEMAAAHFAARGRTAHGRTIRLLRPARAAVAATLLVAAVIGYWQLQPGPEPDPGQTDVYADVDGSGRIDIADVLALARSQHADARSQEHLDGHLQENLQEQLDRFAARIVSLKAEGEAS